MSGAILKTWTPEEDALLSNLWPTMGAKCARLFEGRTVKAIEQRAYRLRLSIKGRKIAQSTRRNSASLLPELPVDKVESKDDEPLLIRRVDRRSSKSCFGYIATGAAASIWDLASRSAT